MVVIRDETGASTSSSRGNYDVGGYRRCDHLRAHVSDIKLAEAIRNHIYIYNAFRRGDAHSIIFPLYIVQSEITMSSFRTNPALD